MRSNVNRFLCLWVMCFLGMVSINLLAFSEGVINVDFGGASAAANWNVITDYAGTITDLVTEDGVTTSVQISIPDRFNGTNTSGTASADPALGLPSEATGDSFFGNTGEWSGHVEPTAQVVISGLDLSSLYELTFFACRWSVSDNREAQYTLSGASSQVETLYLDSANNTDTVVISQPITSSAAGEIIVDIQKGPNNNNGLGFYYLGSMVIKCVSSPYNAIFPSPDDGAIDISIEIPLSWTEPNDILNPGYIVHMGSDPNASETSFPETSALTIDPGTLDNETLYYWRVDVIDPNDGGVSCTYEGDAWSFTTVTATPIFAIQPQDQSVFSDEMAIFSVALVDPAGVSYQWYRGSGDLLVDTAISGAITDTLIISLAALSDEDDYYCVATNSAGGVASDTALLSIKRLMFHWPLDSDLIDIVGAKDGTMTVGTPIYDTGVINGALSLSGGLDDWVEVGSVGTSGNASRTITGWINAATETVPEWTGVFGFSTSASGENRTGEAESFDIERLGSGSNGFGLHQFYWQAEIVSDITVGEWIFVVGSHDGTTTRWYGNGTLIGQEARTLSTIDFWSFGKRASNDNTFTGLIDDVRLYNYALSDIEVAQLWVHEKGGYVCIGGNPPFDFNEDCIVDMTDFAMLANEWLSCNRYPQCVE